MTQACNRSVEISAVLYVGSKSNSSGAVVLARLHPTRCCPASRILSLAQKWIQSNRIPDVRLETFHDVDGVCRPTYGAKNRVCTAYGYCRLNNDATEPYKALKKCRNNRSQTKESKSGECDAAPSGDPTVDLFKHCPKLD